MDSGINYTKQVTGTTVNTTFAQETLVSGNTYIISNGTGAGSYALAANGTSVTRELLSSTTEPSANTQWTITTSGNGYTIRNANGYYLSYSGGLVLNNTASVWTYSNNRFRNGNRYLRYSGGSWIASNNTSGATVRLLSYNYDPNGIVQNTPATSFSRNQYYYSGSGYYNLALTVTSLYNHTDYRPNATISLTTSGYQNLTIYNDFQMNHVKINATSYTSNSSGTNFNSPILTGNLYNVRIGRGMQCGNTGDTRCIFANIIGGRNKFNNI